MTKTQFAPFTVTSCEFITGRMGVQTFRVIYQTDEEGAEFLHTRAIFDGPEHFFYISEIECVEPFQDADAHFQC